MLEFPQEAGYPIGGEFSTKYFMVQIHFDNSHLASNRRDSSGIRFYIGDELRQHDLGYFVMGTQPSPNSLVIPTRVNQFMIDSYCPIKVTQELPESGITVISAFPHTHLQGKSVWTKLIRNNTAVQYLFNGESYNFNYQFENRLPKPIKLYKGDAFVTRCIYNTMNKNEITLGGERTKDEMCTHSFTYYPRINNLCLCVSTPSDSAWETMTDNSSFTDSDKFIQWLNDIKWTPELAVKWQEFYNKASRRILIGGDHFETEFINSIPKYEDLKPEECSTVPTQAAGRQSETFIFLAFIPFIMRKILISGK